MLVKKVGECCFINDFVAININIKIADSIVTAEGDRAKSCSCSAYYFEVIFQMSAMRSVVADVKLNVKRASRIFMDSLVGNQQVPDRLVQKCGLCNISMVNIPKQRRKYFSDIFTTAVELKYRWSLLFFALSFLISWTFFFSVYYLIIKTHGDFDHTGDPDWTPCVGNVLTEADVFIFSFSTQTTTGYGYRYPNTECPLVVMTMGVQFMVGLLCETLMAGVIFAKIARPIKRAATIIFSKNAVVCMRDGKLCMLFRVGDMRKSSLAEAHVRLQMIKKRVTCEGEEIPLQQFDINVGYDVGLDRVFVMWPIIICHVIDENSPLYDVSKKDLETARFEIIAIFEGIVESVGSTTQARTSYLPDEILWGKRFEKLYTCQKENGAYRIDYGKFHEVYDVETPSCSAKEIDELRAAGLEPKCGFQFRSLADSRINNASSVRLKQGKRTHSPYFLSPFWQLKGSSSNLEECESEDGSRDDQSTSITVCDYEDYVDQPITMICGPSAKEPQANVQDSDTLQEVVCKI